MYGVGCLEGRWGWKRKGVVRQALQTLCSGETAEKPQHISRLKKRGFAAALLNKERRCSFRTHSPRCPRQEATPERIVVVQQKELTCSSYYYCAYDNNALNKVRFFPHFKFVLNFKQVSAPRHKDVSSINTQKV